MEPEEPAAEGNESVALSTPSTCLICRKRRRACSKGLPRCERCAGNGLDCVYRLGGLLKSAFANYPRDAALSSQDDDSELFAQSEILFNGVIRPFEASEEAKSTSSKRACVLCHAAKRSCSGTFPCERCVKQRLECVEWVAAKGTAPSVTVGTRSSSGVRSGRDDTPAVTAKREPSVTRKRRDKNTTESTGIKEEGLPEAAEPSGNASDVNSMDFEHSLSSNTLPFKRSSMHLASGELNLNSPNPDDLPPKEGRSKRTRRSLETPLELPALQSPSNTNLVKEEPLQAPFDPFFVHSAADPAPQRPSELGGLYALSDATFPHVFLESRSSPTLLSTSPSTVISQSARSGDLTLSPVSLSPPLDLRRPSVDSDLSGDKPVVDETLLTGQLEDEEVPFAPHLTEEQVRGIGELINSLGINNEAGLWARRAPSGFPVSLSEVMDQLLPGQRLTSNQAIANGQQYDSRALAQAISLTCYPNVPQFFSPFPETHTLPADEITGSLIRTFTSSVEDVFPYLHHSVFAGLLRNNRTLISSMCLGAFHASEDPEITIANSMQVQYRLFAHTMKGITAVLDKYLEGGDATSGDDEERMDALCETLFSLCMVAFWASNCGQVKLFTQVVDIAFRLMFRIGLHHDSRAQFGRATPREAWIRRNQRRILWWCLSYTVFFANHWLPNNDRMSRIIEATDKMTIPMFPGLLWRAQSDDPSFNPAIYDPFNMPYPPLLNRPVVYGDLLGWMKLPEGSMARRQLLEFIGHVIFADDRRYDTRFSYVLEYIHYNMRLMVTQFLEDCKRAGVTPADLVAYTEGRPIPAKIAENWDTLGPLLERRRELEKAITDFLAAMPSKIRRAEEAGDYATIQEFISEADELYGDGVDIDSNRIATHVQVFYFIDLRAMKLELKTSFGLLTFAEIAEGKMDAEFVDSPAFRECLKDSVIYTRHIKSLLHRPWPLRFDIYHTGLTAPKVGAFHLALLSYFLRHPPILPETVPVIHDLRSDMDVVRRFVSTMAPEKRPKGSKMWQATVKNVFTKFVTHLEKSQGYRTFFGSIEGMQSMLIASSATLEPEAAASQTAGVGLEPMEIEIAHLRRDVAVEDESGDTFVENLRWVVLPAELDARLKSL